MNMIRGRVPMWFTVVAIVLVLWGLTGCFTFVQQLRLGAEAMGPATDYDRALFATLPAWYNPVYGVATIGGLLGAVALLARSRLARPLFIASLIAVIVQFGWLFATTDIIASKGAAATVPFPLFIAAVATFQLWLAGFAQRKGWIA